MFTALAPFYDSFLAQKDYRGEAARLRAIARRYVRTPGASWLDVGCGTGRHLELLRRDYRVEGVDASPAMLRIARRRLPGVRLRQGDVRRLRLGRRFDVVSCLFGVVGHIPSERELRDALSALADHVRPGGIVLVEPWIDPANYRPGLLYLMAEETGPVTVVRLAHSSRRGNLSIVRCHYLIGDRSRGIRHLEGTDVGRMVPRVRFRAWLRQAGLRPRYLARGLRPRWGLWVGFKPHDRAATVAGPRGSAAGRGTGPATGRTPQ